MSGMRMSGIFFSALVLASSVRTDGQPNEDIITVIKEMKAELKDVKQHVQQQEVKDNATQQILKMLIYQNTEMKSTLHDLTKEVKTIRQTTQDAKDGVKKVEKEVITLKKEVEDTKEMKIDVGIIKSVLTKPTPGKTWQIPSESCEWLNKRFFNLKTGNYWTSVNGNPKYQHCTMNEGGIPPVRCSSKPCHADATCEDTNTSVKCTCNCGYIGDGKQCTKSSSPVKNSTGTLLISKECAPKKNTLLTTFRVLHKEYLVTFELFFKTIGPEAGTYNVFHFTTGGDCCEIGMRIPSVWVHHKNMLHICSTINDIGGACLNTVIPLNQWSKAEVKQRKDDRDMYIYSVTVNGQCLYTGDNLEPREFRNVKLYMSDPYYPVEQGYIRNLFVQGYE